MFGNNKHEVRMTDQGVSCPLRWRHYIFQTKQKHFCLIFNSCFREAFAKLGHTLAENLAIAVHNSFLLLPKITE